MTLPSVRFANLVRGYSRLLRDQGAAEMLRETLAKALVLFPCPPSCRAIWCPRRREETCSLSRRHDRCTSDKPCSLLTAASRGGRERRTSVSVVLYPPPEYLSAATRSGSSTYPQPNPKKESIYASILSSSTPPVTVAPRSPLLR